MGFFSEIAENICLKNAKVAGQRAGCMTQYLMQLRIKYKRYSDEKLLEIINKKQGTLEGVIAQEIFDSRKKAKD